MSAAVALDTSVAVPLLLASHPSHRAAARWLGARRAALSGHARAETYSVLTRLPGDARAAPADVARALEASFEPPLVLRAATARRLPLTLARLGVTGGAVYDALVAFAARENRLTLATRDARALSTYALVGVDVALLG